MRTNPDWLKAPTAQDLMGMWPAAALKQQLGGKVRMTCEVDLQGLVQDCHIDSEDPPGMGFGPAALALTSKFLFKPATLDGHPVPSEVTIPLNFELEGGRSSMREPQRPPIGSHIPRSGVFGEPTGPSFALIASAPWASAPSEQQVAEAYPKRAKPDTAFGHVVLACTFTKAGDLHDCSVASEEPGGQGFGPAARLLVPFFHMDPASAPGTDLTHVRVNLAVHFIAPAHRDERRLIDRPDWVSDGNPGVDLFPAKASQAGLTTGRAVLDCVANASGRMTGCQVTSEDPAGMDFATAALKTAEQMTLNPWTVDGTPADGAHVVFAVRINKSEPDSGRPAAGP